MSYYIVLKKCNSCKDCLQVCMNNAIVDLDDELHINPAWCIECGSCEAMCYEDAIGYEGLTENSPHYNIGDITWDPFINSSISEYFVLS